MGIENDTRQFLILILNTISIVLIWMILNVLVGIYFGLGFFDGSPTWKNYLYYAIALTSLFFMVRYLLKKWKI